MRTVYLIGAPGSGKSTTVRLATAHWEHLYDTKDPFAHQVYVEGIILGRGDAMFPGTDTLSMSVNPLAIEFMQRVERRSGALVVGEGDRLANRKFLSSCPGLTLIHLDVPVAVARERARLRAEEHGTRVQDESWWKGRVTKIDNLRAQFPHVTVDGSRTPDVVASDVREIIEGRR